MDASYCGDRQMNDNNSINTQLTFKARLSKVKCVVWKIEKHLINSQLTDSKMMVALEMDKMKREELEKQLEQTEKENKQLLNALQEQTEENGTSKSNSRSHMDQSYPTISMVNMQYKYEELAESHQGLLRILEKKAEEIKMYKYNCDQLEEEKQLLNAALQNSEEDVLNLCDKYQSLRNRKNHKIICLKSELQTLKEAHDKLLQLLENQNLDHETEITNLLKCTSPSQAALLQEIKRTNELQYENYQLKLELETLRHKCEVKVTKSLPNIVNDK